MTRESDEADTLPGSVDDLTLGVDSVLGRAVAMVNLPPARGEALALRTEQVRRLAGLHHPSLLEVYDVDGLAEDTASTLVLQSVEGHALDDVTRDRRWPAVSVAHVGAQVADGLAHAHAHGVVHGGVGPASIVVDESLHAWLTGFTAALHPAPETTPTDPTGVDGPTSVSPDTDVAALALALRALLDDTSEIPAVLGDTLEAMREGGVDARAAAGALARAADASAHGGGTGGVVPLAVHTARIVTTPEQSAAAEDQPAAAPALAAAPAPVPASSVSPAPRARPGWGPGRSVRTAVLGGAAATLAVASGAVLWATNSFSAPLDEPVSAPVGVLDPAAGAPVPNPAPSVPAGGGEGPRFSDDPITDVTTLPRTDEVADDAGEEPAVTPSAEAARPPDGPPLAPPPLVPPPPSGEPSTPPPSGEPSTPPPSGEPSTPPPSGEPSTPPPSGEPSTPPPSGEPSTPPPSGEPSTPPTVPPAGSLRAAPPV